MTGGENILTIKQLMEDEPLTDEFSINKSKISQELKTLILIEQQNTTFTSGERVYYATNAQQKIADKAGHRKWHLLMKHRNARSFALEDLTYQEFRKIYTKDLPRENSLAQDVAQAVRRALKLLKLEK
jgi:hypothetical protein